MEQDPPYAQGHGEWPSQRLALFVDTQNLYYAARDHAAAAVDYQRLLELVVRGRRLAHATAYVVEREGDNTSFGFFTKLSALGYRVRRLTLRVHRTGDDGRLVLDGDWDMGIAADMVRAMDHVDVLVLASGDGDFAPILELAQQRGKRCEIVAFRQTTSQAVFDLADRFIDLSEVEGIFLPGRTAP